MKKILVVTKNWLGDVIFEEPFIRALKSIYPHSSISVLTNYRTEEILAANPNIDKLIAFDDRKKDKSFLKKIKIVKLIKKHRFDSAFLLHRSFSRAAILKFAGVKEIYGYNLKGRSFFLTKGIREPDKKMHRSDYWLNILYSIGFDNTFDNMYRFYYTSEDDMKVLSLLKKFDLKEGKYACINPGANWDKKRWSLENFAILAKKIYEVYGLNVVITGSAGDEELGNYILSRNNGYSVSFCGKTSIRELGPLFKRSKIVISADSGPMHIASGAGANVVALFGPTDSVETGPNGIGKHIVIHNLPPDCVTPCFNPVCGGNLCMENIKVDDVMSAVNEIIG